MTVAAAVLRDEARRRVQRLPPGRARRASSSSPRFGEQRELDARRAGVEDERSRRPWRPQATALRRALAPRLRDQRRDRARGEPRRHRVGAAGEDDRHRAPSTMPAASAPARKDRLLASMLPASRSGTISTLARPATGESIFLIFAASRLIALSSASGPSRMRAGDLAAVGHLAQRGRLDRRRHLRVDRLHRRQDRDPHLGERAARARGRSRSGRCRPCPPASARC